MWNSKMGEGIFQNLTGNLILLNYFKNSKEKIDYKKKRNKSNYIKIPFIHILKTKLYLNISQHFGVKILN